MKRTVASLKPAQGSRDVRLRDACLLCDGDIELRVGPSGAYTYCRTCRWLSHPTMHREGSRVRVVHPAAGRA
jgi:hypothetical protein